MNEYPPFRCPKCDARLFDTSGRKGDSDERCVEIHIKCWRCGRLILVRLVPPGHVREAYVVPRKEDRRAA